jgi:hypothetical protein
MAMVGRAALAMWWDMAPQMRDEFQHWHTHEHFPERLSVPGFLRASRWESADGGEGFFVMYEVRDFDVLVSPQYLARLNAPTPWSTKLMPHHRNMVRSQCAVDFSEGVTVAGHLITVRLTQDEDVAAQLRGWSTKPGVSGVHVLRAIRPAISETTEQKIRLNRDGIADRIVVVCGYDGRILRAACDREFGSKPGVCIGEYGLATSMAAADIMG